MQVTTIIARLSLFAVILLLTACNKAQPEGIAGLHLPDINLLFEDYELADSTGNYAAFAHKLVLANRDLNSSELYVEAASLYQQAGNTDSVAILLHKAIDYGMANPNILSRMNIPHGLQKGTAWEELRARLDSIHGKLGKITNFSLQLEAMNQFWPYLDRALEDTSRAKAIFKEYIFSGPRNKRFLRGALFEYGSHVRADGKRRTPLL
jgi:hypothetical protein